ncbi:hypothetical protein [Mucilaginibacter myungsuensis]|uniref:Uncharacterized protein n=1 Tax=Mucilaginibacter myungsuensis TaxID=649104 RepID=A0A929KT62_9SPHI|nr:hypothetical protein [Mucilaginibacter myungsuensis]MBE9661091.1 hypothetical protein [Mucilaginibacter myungsuensis]MDN3597235.1 hypothetical protein [Mucilaginibacter myungsuensis]
MKLAVIVNKVYTLTGIRYLYRLSDFVYGEWLIYNNGDPVFYFNAFDELYQDTFKSPAVDL